MKIHIRVFCINLFKNGLLLTNIIGYDLPLYSGSDIKSTSLRKQPNSGYTMLKMYRDTKTFGHIVRSLIWANANAFFLRLPRLSAFAWPSRLPLGSINLSNKHLFTWHHDILLLFGIKMYFDCLTLSLVPMCPLFLCPVYWLLAVSKEKIRILAGSNFSGWLISCEWGKVHHVLHLHRPT